MVDPTPSDYHVTYLRERWERDRSSRIFLQLAEEYRRRGLHAEALEVLETGLGFHPGYLAAQVALGRCRLEAGQPEEAAAVFERVLKQDPTQAVATRLLVQTWLQLGKRDRARAALERCKLIGIPPSELAGLEERLRVPAPPTSEPERASPPEASAPQAAEAGPAEAALPAPPGPPPASEGAAPPESQQGEQLPGPTPTQALPRPAARPVTSLAPAPSPDGGPAGRTGDIFHLPPGRAAAVVLPLRPGSGERRLTTARSSPFALGRPRARPGRGDLFHLHVVAPPAPAAGEALASEPAAAPAAVAPTTLGGPEAAATPATERARRSAPPVPALAGGVAESGVASPPPAPPAPQPTPDATLAAAAPPSPSPPVTAARWWDRPVAGSAEAAAAPMTATPPPPAAAPPTAPASAAGPPSPAMAPSPAAASPPAARPPAGQPPALPAADPRPSAAAQESAPATSAAPALAAGSGPLAGAAGVEVQPSGSLASPELRPSDPGTATLGELYLRQGYVREAEQIFQQVLGRDPENEAALRGLESIGQRRSTQLAASDLLGGGQGEVRGLTARKIQLLKQYLLTLRRGAGGNVPGTAQ